MIQSLEGMDIFPRSQEFIEKLAGALNVTEIDETFAEQTGAVILRNAVSATAVDEAFSAVRFEDNCRVAEVPLKRAGEYRYLARLGTNNNQLFETIGGIISDVYSPTKLQVQYNQYRSQDGSVAGGGLHVDVGVVSPIVLIGDGPGCTTFVEGERGLFSVTDTEKLMINNTPGLDDKYQQAEKVHVPYGGRDLVVSTPHRLHAGQTTPGTCGLHTIRRSIVVVGRQ